MSAVRKPEPARVMLAQEIISLDARIPAGEGDVEIPAADWERFVDLAHSERVMRVALDDYKRRLAVALGEEPGNPDAVDLIVLAKSTRESADRRERKVAEAFAAVPPPLKKKRERKRKAFCATCNATTPHDGNDECEPCAARELVDAVEIAAGTRTAEPEQVELDEAIGGES